MQGISTTNRLAPSFGKGGLVINKASTEITAFGWFKQVFCVALHAGLLAACIGN
jgi:hypothetical protein